MTSPSQNTSADSTPALRPGGRLSPTLPAGTSPAASLKASPVFSDRGMG
jgi:hypothetical protein